MQTNVEPFVRLVSMQRQDTRHIEYGNCIRNYIIFHIANAKIRKLHELINNLVVAKQCDIL